LNRKGKSPPDYIIRDEQRKKLKASRRVDQQRGKLAGKHDYHRNVDCPGRTQDRGGS